ncbi:MAG: ATP-dependent metalloprotease FtsH [Erysipelotrichaceae bacterium]|nr:MAG: ATP-dependent metalloprotease [Erysipelotrichaceae bacterium]TXT20006.1 MAG: ATP-dependent metalloprotease FtsH [Erysipelotrichaceae bacterium]
MRNQKLTTLIPYIIVTLAVMSLVFMNFDGTTKKLTYSEYVELLNQGKVTESNVTVSTVVIKIAGKYTEGATIYDYTLVVPNTEAQNNTLMAEIYDSTSVVKVIDAYETNAFMDFILNFIPYILMAGLFFFFISRMQGGNNNKAFDFGKSKAKLEGAIKVRFNDVAGCDEEKEEMMELIDYLKNPKKFAKMGARIPKGVLMVGAPGTGKTLLAKAVAGEADVPFYSISGSDFVEMFVGVGASRVRDMFKKAQSTAPCIIFIDEIDAVGRQRGTGLGGGHDEREQTLNQLLVEMDGIGDNAGVIIIAATNRPDVLDPALLRPGRFDRTITVSLPDRKGRAAILAVHARNKKLADSADLVALAKRTPGFSGADLENVLNEAAILAVRENSETITMHHLDEAIDRVIAGPAKKSKTYSDREKRLVAYHEVGHTIVGLMCHDSDMVQKVTIIPRGTAGGYNLMTPREEKFLMTKTDLIAKITGLLGGRVAEEIVFNEISTGASTDIEQATKIAREMVMSYGMSSLGPIQYEHSGGNVFLGRDYNATRNYSSQIAFEIDKSIRALIDEGYEKAKALILQHRPLMDKIVEVLMEQETLTSEQIQNIVEGKPFDTPVIEVKPA